jgi:4-amino-4-deoxy-L-arabinose transferase-like glycosyltransferase
MQFFLSSHIVISIVATLILSLYSQTLSPSIAGGDSGEIVAEGCILGVAHPPGYPILTIIIHILISIFKNGTVAYRINLFRYMNNKCKLKRLLTSYMFNLLSIFYSAICTTGASICIGLSVLHLSPRKHPLGGIILSMGMFALSPLIWQYAVTSEVFPLNTFLASLIIYLTISFTKTNNVYYSYIGALICGLALCNQHTIILYEVPLILWILFLQRRMLIKNISVLVIQSILFIIGISFYVYLPIASHMSPKDGSWGDVTSLYGFIHHFLRRDYGTFQLYSGASGKVTECMIERTISYLRDFTFDQGLYVSSLLAIIAIVNFTYGFNTSQIYDMWKHTSSINNGNASKLSKIATISNSSHTNNTNKKNKTKNSTMEPQPTTLTSSVNRNDVSRYDLPYNEVRYTPLVIFFTLVFYIVIFHSLSNLPLNVELLYGVHQRFWMQPNIILFMLSGIGYNNCYEYIDTWYNRRSQNNKSNYDSVKSNDDSNIKESSTVDIGETVLFILNIVLAIIIVYLQVNKWYTISDQSDAYYFRDYASAILDALPNNSILLINYDQQWTSVRYMQKCENFRNDITAINLSMMTYYWFKYKHNLYPQLKFPLIGHLSSENSNSYQSKKSFTLYEFIELNYPNHNIYLSGKMSFVDSKLEQFYEHIPIGMVAKLQRKDHIPNATTYSVILRDSWQVCMYMCLFSYDWMY